MSLVNRIRRQYAVKWPNRGRDNFGRYRYGAPVEIRVRWEGMTEETVAMYAVAGGSTEIVYVKLGDVKIGDAIWQGRLADLPTDKTVADPFADATGNEGTTWEVARLTTYPSMRANPSKTLVVASLGPKSKLTQSGG